VPAPPVDPASVPPVAAGELEDPPQLAAVIDASATSEAKTLEDNLNLGTLNLRG